MGSVKLNLWTQDMENMSFGRHLLRVIMPYGRYLRFARNSLLLKAESYDE